MWKKIRRVAIVGALCTVAVLAALLAPFPLPFRGWLRGDRDDVPTELVARDQRPGA